MNRRALTPHAISWQVRTSLLVLGAFVLFPACASKPVVPEKAIYESGLNVVRLEGDPDAGNNTHPITLTPTQIGTLLRGVRTWEQRNFVHRLVSGEANRTRAFRDEEITLLAPALSKAQIGRAHV